VGVGLKDRLRRVEKEAEGEMIVLPQEDGAVKRFSQQDSVDAFINLCDRLGAGDDTPPEHPMIEAIRNSTEPKWTGSFYAVNNPEEWVKPVEDLSE
jgi:hypothetical protein